MSRAAARAPAPRRGGRRTRAAFVVPDAPVTTASGKG